MPDGKQGDAITKAVNGVADAPDSGDSGGAGGGQLVLARGGVV